MEPAQTTNIVDVYVNYLRRKLKDPPPGRLIRTVRGHGYTVPPEDDLLLGLPVAQALLPTPPILPAAPVASGPAFDVN